jgi:branched-chain amino acid transport system permease protein
LDGALNALVVFSNFVLVPGLAYGAQLALGALGVTLVYAVLRFANFAHGDTMAFGTTVVILGTWGLQALDVNLGPVPTALLVLPLGIAVTAWLLLLTDRWIYRFHRAERSPPVIFVILSIGVMFVLNGLVRFVIGPDDQRFADGARFLMRAPEFEAMTGLDEGLTIRTTQALTLAVAAVTVVALFWFLMRTRTGKAMRAYADNEDLALLSGVDPDRVVRVTWMLAATLAVVAGTLYGLDKSFKPFTYFQLLLPVFAAAIVGGIGQPVGAIAGGFVVAFSELGLTYAYKRVISHLVPEAWEPSGLVQLLGTDYKFAISFIILVVVLLVRPTGLFRGQVV